MYTHKETTIISLIIGIILFISTCILFVTPMDYTKINKTNSEYIYTEDELFGMFLDFYEMDYEDMVEKYGINTTDKLWNEFLDMARDEGN